MLLSFSLVSAALLTLAEAAPAGCCKDPIVRKEWRTLSNRQQLEFIDAVKCLQSKPAQLGSLYEGVRSRFDDFQALHIDKATVNVIHMVGQFLPWHRTFLALYEGELRSTCGYKGALPYWNWSKDAVSESAFLASPIFDDVYGFGGNGAYIEDISNMTQTASGLVIPGRSGGGCLTTGPFANLTVPMGPGASYNYTPHCLRRDIAPTWGVEKCNQQLVDWTLTAPTFATYDMRVEAMNLTLDGAVTHSCGHWGVGGSVGEMSDVWSAPGDPIFYLHHANLDYLWNKWQHLDWAVRKSEIGGPDTPGAYPYLFFGDIPYSNVTLDYELDLGEIAGSIPIRDIIDTKDGILCYTYE